MLTSLTFYRADRRRTCEPIYTQTLDFNVLVPLASVGSVIACPLHEVAGFAGRTVSVGVAHKETGESATLAWDVAGRPSALRLADFVCGARGVTTGEMEGFLLRSLDDLRERRGCEVDGAIVLDRELPSIALPDAYELRTGRVLAFDLAAATMRVEYVVRQQRIEIEIRTGSAWDLALDAGYLVELGLDDAIAKLDARAAA